MKEDLLLYTLALKKIPKIGDISAKKLINYCGSAEAVFKESPKNLLKIGGIGKQTLTGISKTLYIKEAEEELKFIKSHKIEVHYYKDELYPELLKQCIDGPILLFQKGSINLKKQRIISIVGTRKITTSGIAFCEKLVNELAIYNPIIVSGFAYGTDITAQKAAIKNRLQTIGCLAHGLNQMYPKVHEKYIPDVEQHGGFLTDFSSTDSFDRNNFLKRNRIIAGISEATLVIESAKKGGSLVTADIANSYNRDVFAVPGRPTDTLSVGCNNLIKSHKAHALTTPMDIPYILNWDLPNNNKTESQTNLFIEYTLNPQEELILNYLKKHPKSLLDEIAIECQFPSYKIASILLNMELKGIVKPLPGKLFEITR